MRTVRTVTHTASLSIIALFFTATLDVSPPAKPAVQMSPAAVGDVGDVVHRITVPVPGSPNHCSVGLAFNGTHLFYDRCQDDVIYQIDPHTGALIDSFDTNISERPNALSYDVSRNGIWIGAQACNATGMPIYLWDLDDDSVTLRFTIPSALTNPATGSTFLNYCFTDGLAFDANDPEDPNDDEIWFSDDVNPNLGVFSTSGTFLRGYDARVVESSLATTSGLAIGGQYLYLANNGGGDVFRADKLANPLTLIDQFVSGDTRQEDMECDPITFAPTQVMWVRTTPQSGQFPDVVTAYEIEPNSCALGGAPADADGDGLFDVWEREGIDENNDGTPEVDLPGMGADPNKRDVFVEVDWMEASGVLAHSHQPNPDAIEKVVQAFAGAPGGGINLHVDVGPDSTDYVTGQKWGARAHGQAIPHQTVLGNTLNETTLSEDWQNLVDQYFGQDNRVFRHAVFAHIIASKGVPPCTSGIAILQYLIVALGGYPNCPLSVTGVGSENQQAGTFMHELGHTLGLQHGGDRGEKEFNYKPNYLSVMNYSFQLGGLIYQENDGHFDYSRADLPDLNEAALSESFGLGGDQVASYGTKYKASAPYLCLFGGVDVLQGFAIVTDASGAINWDCDNGIDSGTVQQDINGAGGNTQQLTGYDDWANLQFHMGNVGALGAPPPISVTEELLSQAPVELTEQESLAIPQISEPRVALSASVTPSGTRPGGIVTYTVVLSNTDLAGAQGIVVSVTLPPGFVYKLGSTSGITTANPIIVGPVLSWGQLTVLSDSNKTLVFRASTPYLLGSYPISATGQSTNGVVLPTGVTAPVTVSGSARFMPLVTR